ncbi:DHA2 family efflux MFS transporter permease subunit [Longimicrobium sp.]|uniref:DHA2 family efflux MFS transporter permease subunit n=1 Tax=Longimicrobium sp. TaxID=2029185 RepID=UPI002C3BF260|nr:DHA2 family efflux MFS transporter permease subunit [Longimicrobium sp.]HSU12844.1 DHA2 family efflux MFS transporter permease subunit [Longimicrobium sp.]
MSTVAMRMPGAAEDPYAHRYLIAAAVSVASMLQVIDTSIVNVAIPNMMGSLGATIDEISLVSTGYIVASVIVIPLTGWLGDYFGRRRYFAGSILLFTAASFFCGTARSLDALVVWRIIQGVGGGALLSTSQAILYEAFPKEEVGKGLALWGLGVMVGPTLGPTLGGWLTDNWSWPWIFFINVPLGIIAALMVMAYVRDSAGGGASRGQRVDWTGIVLLTVSVGALQWMLERGERYDWFDSRLVIGLLVVSVAGGATLVWRELTVKHPVIDFRLLKQVQFTVGTIMGIILGAGLMGSVFVLPIFLQSNLHMTAWQTGIVLLPGALATAVAMTVVGRLSSQMDNRILVVVGTALFGWAMWDLSHLTTQSGPHDFFWPLILRGFGLGLMFIPLTNLTMAEVSQADMSQASGLYNFFRQLGGSFSIAVMASALTRFTMEKYAVLVPHISLYDAATRQRIDGMAAAMTARGMDPFTAHKQAIAMLMRSVQAQASVLAFEKIYLLSGAILVVSAPLLLLFRTGRPGHKVEMVGE